MSTEKTIEKIFANPFAGLVAVGVVGAVVLYFLGKRVVADVVKGAEEVNKGTAYEGSGAVGTLGNVTNQVSGGFLQSIGEWVGAGLPNNTPNTIDQAYIDATRAKIRAQTLSGSGVGVADLAAAGANAK